ncbi:MAG: sensor histidine kinase [Taibaiella sp.]|jgi:signal transduction histidine kinase
MQQHLIQRIFFIILVGCFLHFTSWSQARSSFIETLLEGKTTSKEQSREQMEQMELKLHTIDAIYNQYPDSALALSYAVFNMSKQMDFPDGMASALIWMGSIHIAKGGPHEALKYLRKALPYCEQAVNVKETLLLVWKNDMAAAFSIQGAYDSAMVYYYQALQTALKYNSKDYGQLAVMYNNVSSIHYVLKQYDDALPYLEKAKQLAISKQLKPQLTETYITLASIFIVKDQLDSAKQYLENIGKLNTTITAKIQEQLHYLNGIIYLKQKLPAKAIPLFKEALVLSEYNIRNKINNTSALGSAYLLLKNYKSAVQYYLEAAKLSAQSGIGGRSLVEIYGNLSETYDSAKDYRNAYRYKFIAAALQDSISAMENTKSLNKLENLFQNAEKDKELTTKKLQLVLAKASLRNRNLWIAGIGTGTLILLTIAIMLSQKQRLQLQRAKTTKQQQQVEQLKAVIDGEEKERSRIGRQLHDDIMVQLSIVKMSMEALPIEYPGIKDVQSYKNIVQQVQHTSRQLRQTAHNLMPDALLEEGLISAVLYFCRNIEQMTGIKILFQHYGSIPLLSSDLEISIYRIIQELMQNVIKHAEATNALVQLNYLEGILSITVEDNGIGMKEQDSNLEENKMGLRSIRTRLKAMGGSMEIHPCTPHGTSVNIELSV